MHCYFRRLRWSNRAISYGVEITDQRALSGSPDSDDLCCSTDIARPFPDPRIQIRLPLCLYEPDLETGPGPSRLLAALLQGPDMTVLAMIRVELLGRGIETSLFATVRAPMASLVGPSRALTRHALSIVATDDEARLSNHEYLRRMLSCSIVVSSRVLGLE